MQNFFDFSRRRNFKESVHFFLFYMVLFIIVLMIIETIFK